MIAFILLLLLCGQIFYAMEPENGESKEIVINTISFEYKPGKKIIWHGDKAQWLWDNSPVVQKKITSCMKSDCDPENPAIIAMDVSHLNQDKKAFTRFINLRNLNPVQYRNSVMPMNANKLCPLIIIADYLQMSEIFTQLSDTAIHSFYETCGDGKTPSYDVLSSILPLTQKMPSWLERFQLLPESSRKIICDFFITERRIKELKLEIYNPYHMCIACALNAKRVTEQDIEEFLKRSQPKK